MTDAQATFPRTDLARATLGVLIIVALIALAIWILRPFLGAVVWATMIVVARHATAARGWIADEPDALAASDVQ